MSSLTIPIIDLQSKLLAHCEACYQLAENKLQRKFDRPSINFKLRGKSAGTAHLQQNRLRFNPILLRENPDAFIEQVVPHEICHLLCYQIFTQAKKSIKPHGREWQSLMINIFSIKPQTTHNFDTSSVSGTHYTYQCHCGTVNLSLRRHNKIIRGQAKYLCRKCKHQLTLVNN